MLEESTLLPSSTANLTLNRSFDAFGRVQGLTLTGADVTVSRGFAYEAASGRLASVTAPDLRADYYYVANSDLVDHVYMVDTPHNVSMTTTRQYDRLNRLTNLVSDPRSFSYRYNAANQRTRVADDTGAYWLYGYDRLGQVTNGYRHWPDGQLVAAQQFDYQYDDIGNRTLTRSGGDQFGANWHLATSGANALNQYTNRTVPGYADILGSAATNATVTVNDQRATRQGEYYRVELPATNANNPVALDLTTLAVLRQGTNGDLAVTNSGRLLVPRTPEEFIHDGDGNLTQDGLWNYTWDAENRLVRMVSRSEVPESSRQSLSFRYDDHGRRISKTVSNWVTGHWSLATDHRFVYDGWNLLAVLNSNLDPLLTFAWGLDLSSTPQGAGGVGGLLWVTHHSPPGTHHFAASDGNGNVVALVNSSDGTVSARYEYGPFAEVLRASGPMARANPFRFSSKYQDDETDLIYYGYRYYTARTGRWISLDPAEEPGGLNLYALCGNEPVGTFDALGLWRSRTTYHEHSDLTEASFDPVITTFPIVTPRCASDMSSTLMFANDLQDEGRALSQLERHYNRRYVARENAAVTLRNRTAADQRYATLLDTELNAFFTQLANGHCLSALRSLGALSHSWQDYYAHAIHQSTGFADAAISGSPDSGGGPYWPSSYSGFWIASIPAEHPASRTGREPFNEGTAVWQARWNAAIQFVQDKYFNYLGMWVAECSCCCNDRNLSRAK